MGSSVTRTVFQDSELDVDVDGRKNAKTHGERGALWFGEDLILRSLWSRISRLDVDRAQMWANANSRRTANVRRTPSKNASDCVVSRLLDVGRKKVEVVHWNCHLKLATGQAPGCPSPSGK